MLRKLSFIAGIVVVFASTVFILLHLFPGPHQPADYIVVGTIATFICILLVFVGALSTIGKRGNVFYRRRR